MGSVLIDGKRAPLKTVLEKQLCLPIDVVEQTGFRKNTRAFSKNPSLGRLFGKEGRTCFSL
jgi:hypothetical protein